MTRETAGFLLSKQRSTGISPLSKVLSLLLQISEGGKFFSFFSSMLTQNAVTQNTVSCLLCVGCHRRSLGVREKGHRL